MKTENVDTSPVDFRTEPARYKHWRLAFDGSIANLRTSLADANAALDDVRAKLDAAG